MSRHSKMTEQDKIEIWYNIKLLSLEISLCGQNVELASDLASELMKLVKKLEQDKLG